MKVKWIKHTEYSHWAQTKNLNYKDIRWIGVVCRTPGNREVVLRALQNGSSFLIRVREKMVDFAWVGKGYQYNYDGKPRITLSCTGSVEFRDGFHEFQDACIMAITKYVSEFMNVGDLEKIRKRIIE